MLAQDTTIHVYKYMYMNNGIIIIISSTLLARKCLHSIMLTKL